MNEINDMSRLLKNNLKTIKTLKKEIYELKCKREESLLNDLHKLFLTNNLIKKYGLSVSINEDRFIIKDIAIYSDKKPSFIIEVYVPKIYLPIESNEMNMVAVNCKIPSTKYWERSIDNFLEYSINDIKAIKNRIIKLLRKNICYRLQRINHDMYINDNRNIALFSKNYKETWW